MSAPKSNFDISKLVEEVYEAFSYAAARKGLRYTFAVSHKVPRNLHGDRESIYKALSVITSMAIEDSQNGTVELNVDLQFENTKAIVVKFVVNESTKQIPYWFSASLQLAKSKKVA